MSIEAFTRTTTTLARDEPVEPPDPYLEHAKVLLGDDNWAFIADAAAVKDAFKALVLPCDADFTVDACSRSVARLLNAISLTLYVHYAREKGIDLGPAVVSHPAAAVQLTGDYLGIDESPDWVSYATTMRELQHAGAVPRDKDPLTPGQPVASGSQIKSKAWSEILAVGECGRRRRPQDTPRSQMNWYLNTLKRYRPDLSATQGLRLQGGLAWLASFDAHGVATSDPTFGHSLEPWIAHIAFLYYALETRDKRFTYLGPTLGSARWGVETDTGAKIVIEPFYSTHRAGKMTWAAFETRTIYNADGRPTYGDAPVGFFKTSWQKKRAACKKGKAPIGDQAPQREDEFLDLAHAGSWLPGLARHWTSAEARKNAPRITVSRQKGDRTRTLENHSLHLASVGQPLSQCKSALHLIKVIYDAIQTHLELCKRGVLHRDVSWHNLLCNPIHDPAVLLSTPGKEVASVEDVPCIEYILTGDKSKESCALLTDLDVSTTFTVKDGEPVLGCSDLVGTPMFVAVERSSGNREERLPGNHLHLKDVLPKLREIESHPELFKRAFPKGDNGFAVTIAQVFKNEERNGAVGKTNPDTPHLPRHDVESLFWILFWSLARACPVGSDPLDEIEGDLSSFVQAMMLHGLDEEKLRRTYFKKSHFDAVLHRRLAPRFAPLLENMLRYLSVPWHRYDKVVGNYHAHIAMMRLLLVEISALTTDPTLDVQFDTTQPRIRNLEIDNPWPESSCKRITFAELTNVVAGNAESAATTLVDSSGAASMVIDQQWAKRKRASDDGAEDDMSRSKRQKLDAMLPAETTRPPSFTVSQLGDIFWDTRMWFGIGNRDEGPKRAAQLAQRGLIVSDTVSECA